MAKQIKEINTVKTYVVPVKGDKGDTGAGFPIGGTENQVLAKISDTDFDTEWKTLDKTDVGLSNVDNTSDVNKPISTATQTALNTKVDKVAGERLITASEITKLANQSGVNTGDQDLSGYATTSALTTGLSTKQNTVSLTTTGTSGVATFNPTTGALNIPNYAVGGGGSVTNVSSANSNIAVINPTTTPVLTLSSTITSNTSGNAATATNVAFSGITSKPTTLSGYGITDAYPLTENPSGFLTSTSIATGQTIGANTTGSSAKWGGISAPTVGITPSLFLGTDGTGNTANYVTISAAKTALAISLQDVSDVNNNVTSIRVSTNDANNDSPVRNIDLNSKIGVANGIAPLDGSNKVPLEYLPSGTTSYVGTWDASTNTPTLANGTGVAGNYYIVNIAGTQNLGGGSIAYAVGDNVIYNGTVWDRIPNSGGVTSVNGMTGTVSLTTANVPEGTNLYYTEARVNANTNVSANTASRHNAVTLGTSNGLSLISQQLSLALASTSTTGALSDTDWDTFNNKGNGSVTIVSSANSNITVSNSTTTPTLTLASTITSNTSGNAATANNSALWNGYDNDFTTPKANPDAIVTYNNTGATVTRTTINTAFNKNFGTAAGTVAEGNDSRINNGQIAFGWGNHASVGYTTASNTQTFTNKSGNISQWTNNIGYITSSAIATGQTIGANTTGSADLFAGMNFGTSVDEVPDYLLGYFGTGATVRRTNLLSKLRVNSNDGNINSVVRNTDLSTYATQAYADAKVADNLTASTTVAPSKTAVNNALALKENTSNKQNSLATDGTGVKFPTVDAVNAGINGKANLVGGNNFTGNQFYTAGDDITLLNEYKIEVSNIATSTSTAMFHDGFNYYKNGWNLNIKAPNITLTNKIVEFQDKSGTVALTSDLPTGGTYLPTVTAVSNNSSPTITGFKYTRINNIVTFSGKASINATVVSDNISIDFTLPIASDFTSNDDITGTINVLNNYGATQPIFTVNTTTNKGVISFFNGSITGANVYYFTGQYEIK